MNLRILLNRRSLVGPEVDVAIIAASNNVGACDGQRVDAIRRRELGDDVTGRDGPHNHLVVRPARH